MSKFTEMAKRAKKTPDAFAEANIHTDGEVGRLARLYYLMQGTHGGGKARMDTPGDTRSIGTRLYQIG